jgi:hypothetical protein
MRGAFSNWSSKTLLADFVVPPMSEFRKGAESIPALISGSRIFLRHAEK